MFAIMRYITLDGRFTKVYGYHFVLLNHFRYDEKVNIPYFLICSMNATIKAHRDNPKGDTTMHQGLMVLIYDHLKDNQISHPILLSLILRRKGQILIFLWVMSLKVIQKVR